MKLEMLTDFAVLKSQNDKIPFRQRAGHLPGPYGLSQVTLKNPSRIYHQDHDTSEMASRPTTSYDQYWEDTKRMFKSKKPIILNDETWGLGEEDLRESVID